MRQSMVAFAVATLLAAGCVGPSDAADGPQASALFDEETGVLRGRVLDEELRGVANASVGIASLDILRVADADGSFILDHLAPGTYEVSAYALGYEAQARPVEIQSAQSTDVTFTLRALPSAGAYFEVSHYVGFQPCQWHAEGIIAHCTYPYTNAYGTARRQGVNLSSYGLPRDVQDTRDRYNFSVRLDHTGGVSELYWLAASTAATWQLLVVDCAWYDPFWDECIPPDAAPGQTGVRYFTKVGKSPVRIEWKHPNMKHLALNPWMMARANVYSDPSGAVQAGFAFDQRIEMYNTVFYGAEPPTDFNAGPVEG